MIKINKEKIKREIREDWRIPLECPKCNSKEVVSCKGSTCLKPILSINWICKRCLYEW